MFQLLDISKKKCDFDKICDLALKELDIAKDGRISKSKTCIIFQIELWDFFINLHSFILGEK
jgi:hypothetical protein